MTISLYIQIVAMFILGQMLQLFWLKIPSLKKRAKVANYKFSVKDYFSEDWHLIAGTQVFGAMAVLGLNELTHWRPEILDVVKWFFAAIGAFGSSVVLSKLSVFEKKLSNVIDFKTNIGDAVTETDEKGKPIEMQDPAPGEKK